MTAGANVKGCNVHEDASLVKAALAGDRSAFGDLYDRYAPLVRAVCYGATRDLTHAQDLSQEVFLRAWRGLDRLAEPRRFGGWVMGIARQAGREWRRRQGRDRRRLTSLAGQDPPAPQPDGDRDELDRLAAAIERLSERERLALHAYYLLEKSPQEAAGVLGLSRSGFYGLLQRARRSLEKMLTKDGRQSHV